MKVIDAGVDAEVGAEEEAALSSSTRQTPSVLLVLSRRLASISSGSYSISFRLPPAALYTPFTCTETNTKIPCMVKRFISSKI